MKTMPALLLTVGVFFLATTPMIVEAQTLATRYTVSADQQEVMDSESGLVWRHCAEGMTAQNNTCEGIARKFTSYSSKQYAAKLPNNAGKAWRLPTIDELMTINERQGKPTIDSSAFPATPAEWFWSSSPGDPLSNPGDVWGVDFADGEGGTAGTTNTGKVRLVRETVQPSTVQEAPVNSAQPVSRSEDLLERPGTILPADRNTSIWEIRYTDDGKVLVSVSHQLDKNNPSEVISTTVKLWDTSNWHLLRSIDVGKDLEMAISRDGRWLATGPTGNFGFRDKGRLGPLHVWDANSGTLVHTLDGGTDGVMSLTFSHDGAQLISTSESTLRVWDAVSGRQLRKIPFKGEALDLTPDGHQLVYSIYQPKKTSLKFMDLASGKDVRAILLPNYEFMTVFKLSADGRRATINQDHSKVEIWDIVSGRKLFSGCNNSFGISKATFTPDGSQILLTSCGGTPGIGSKDQYSKIEIWDSTCSTLQRTIRRTADSGWSRDGNGFSISPDGRQLAYGTGNGHIEIWDVWKGSEQASINAAVNASEYREALAHLRKGEDYFFETVPPNYSEAFKFYQVAAEKGNDRAAYMVGYMCLNGYGVAKDNQLALKWLRLAVDLGYASARRSLAFTYLNLKDYSQSLIWAYITAVDLESKETAEAIIAACEKQLTIDQVTEAQRLAKECTARKFKGCNQL